MGFTMLLIVGILAFYCLLASPGVTSVNCGGIMYVVHRRLSLQRAKRRERPIA